MGRCKRVHADELVGNAEAARLVGMTLAVWATYRYRGVAPAPLAKIGGAPVWTRAQLREWDASRPKREK